MSKIFKITLILFVILSSIYSFSLATDIDMNITADDNDTTENLTTNTITNTVNNNRIENEEAEDSSNVTNTDNGFTTITSVDKSSTQDDGLGLSNILNILLIVVGVVLILLAIAILIRLHS